MMILLTNIGFIIIAISLLLAFLFYSRNKTGFQWKFPVAGQLLEIVRSLEQFHDRFVPILESNGGTFFLQKRSPIANMDIIVTSDPANVHHIMSANFSKYVKGIEWRKRFDIFGDSLFNSDFVEWKYNRAFFKGFFNHQKFHELMPKIYEDSMAKLLIPLLDHVSNQNVHVALHHLLGKHMYYIASRMSFGCDPNSSCDENLFSRAMVDACEAISFRFILPEWIWKLQKWLRIGKEKRLIEASVTLYHLISESIRLTKEHMMDFSVLKLFLLRDIELATVPTKDNILAFMFAAHDTTSTTLTWFFWLLSKHPNVQNRIREEIQKHFPQDGETKWLPFGAKELNKMVYLHAALCETLRLYPPAPIQLRSALQHDTLPSGHNVNPRTMVSISTYAMGRMKSIWGEDCHEFKPERWITSDGGIKHVAAYKFFAFNAGPRSCLGKDIAFTLMKAITSSIIRNYDILVLNNHQITPKPSIVLHMNHDLMVTIKKRYWA